MSRSAIEGKSRDGLLAAALFCATLLLYSPAWHLEFIDCDDPLYVTCNGPVQAGLSWAGTGWALTSLAAANWHPLTWLSHMLDWQLWGANPAGHHATNVLLHALNAGLVYALFRRLGITRALSWLAAALFAWHPLRVESVAWVAERKDVLSGAFFLLTLLAYLRYGAAAAVGPNAHSEEPWPKNCPRAQPLLWYGTALALFALGLMSKPMLVTLPCLLLLLDYWPLQRWGGPAWRRLGVEKLPFALLSAGCCLVTYFAQREGKAMGAGFDVASRLDNAVVSLARYLGKILAPSPLALGYPHPERWPLQTFLAAGLLLLGLSALVWWQWRRRPWLLVGWLWFLGMLVPVLGLVQVGLQGMADRYTYLPVLGLELALAAQAAQASRRWSGGRAGRLAGSGLALGLLVLCAGLTHRQLGVWHDSLSLYTHAVKVCPDSYSAYAYRACSLINLGRLEEAAADSRRALALKPDLAQARCRLAAILEWLHQPEQALEEYQTLLRLRPLNLDGHLGLASLLVRLGRPAEALPYLDFCLSRRPQEAEVWVVRGAAAAHLGRWEEALCWDAQALRLDPSQVTAHLQSADALAELQRHVEALAHYGLAQELNPGLLEAWCHAGNSFRALGRLEEARQAYRKALSLQPNCAAAHYGLGAVLEESGLSEAAALEYELAQRLDPQDAAACYNLGALWLNQGRTALALVEFARAIELQPDHGLALAGLGLVEAQLGFPAAALRHLQAARQNKVELPHMDQLLAHLAHRKHPQTAPREPN